MIWRVGSQMRHAKDRLGRYRRIFQALVFEPYPGIGASQLLPKTQKPFMDGGEGLHHHGAMRPALALLRLALPFWPHCRATRWKA